jgi:hypothetical protein
LLQAQTKKALQSKSQSSGHCSIRTSFKTRERPICTRKAWNKYLYAKAIYQETKETDHWRYMQECLSDYEKALMAN